MSIRVVIADDHPVVRDGLRLAIEQSGADIVVAGEAADGLEALELARTARADVFILDVTMPNLNGIETIRELRKRDPDAKCIVLSLHGSEALVDEALAAGARGYLTKEAVTRTVVEAVKEVSAGRSYLCPRVAHVVLEGRARRRRAARRAASPTLSGQERKVLQLVAEGRTNKEMAELLKISVHTVHVHRTSLMAKLDLHNRAGLIRYALREGLAKL